MTCREFLDNAETWMEGERDARAAAHLDGCPRCRGLIGDLESIQLAAGRLEAEVAPPPRLWAAVRAQLEAEGIIREQQRGWTEAVSDWFRLLPRPALAGAYLSLLLAAAVLISFQSGNQVQAPPPLAFAPPAHLTGSAERAVSTLHSHNAEVLRSYRDSLKLVDNHILECEKMVRQEPRNELAREYLYEAYQQKAGLLATLAERGALGE